MCAWGSSIFVCLVRNLDCKFIEEAGGDHVLNNRSGNYYMVADYSLKCYDSAYNGMMVLAVSVVVFFAFGIPLFFSVVLYKKREHLRTRETQQFLGMLYLSYRPEVYWFESVQMLFKLALWASLTFFKDDPQVKIALAQFICFLQVALHARLRPFNSDFKNTMQAFSVCLAFAVGFGGLVINYLRVSQREAFLLSNAELAAALQGKLDGFKIFLEIVLYVTFLTYGVVVLRRVWHVASRHRQKIPVRLRGCCPCWTFREDQEEELETAAPSSGPLVAATVSPVQPEIPGGVELMARMPQHMPSEEISGGGGRVSLDNQSESSSRQERLRSASGRFVDFRGPNVKTNPMYEADTTKD